MTRRQKHLWLVSICFFVLFFVGIAVGKATITKNSVHMNSPGTIDTNYKDKLQNERNVLMQLVKQLDVQKEIPFEVNIKNQTFTGWFKGDTFRITGRLDQHDITLERMSGTPAMFLDGKPQDTTLLPYALYTPYEHANLLKQHINSIQFSPIIHPRQKMIKGYELQLPTEDLQKLLALWMGQEFKADEAMKEIFKNATIQYQIWYDSQDKRLHQIGIHLLLQTASGIKQDEIVFRF